MINTLFFIYVILFIVKSKEIKNLRNLEESIIIEKTFDIKKFTILDQVVNFKEKIALKEGRKISHKIIIETNSGTAIFGSDNLDYETEKSVFQMAPFMKLGIPDAPDVILTLKGVSNILHSIRYFDGIKIYIDATIYANVEYDFGGNFNSIAASAKGTIISFKSFIDIKDYDKVIKERDIIRASGGVVNIHLAGKTVDDESFSYDYRLWNGWNI